MLLIHRSPRILLAISSMVVVTGLGGVLYWTTRESSERRHASNFHVPGVAKSVLQLFDPEQPLIATGSQVAEIPEAASLAGYNIPVIRDTSLPEPLVWVSPDTHEVAARYGSTLVVLYAEWTPKTNAAERYAQEAKDWGVGSATSIADHPAWVIEKDAQSANQPPVNEIYITIGGVEATLLGRMSLDELLDIASKLS